MNLCKIISGDIYTSTFKAKSSDGYCSVIFFIFPTGYFFNIREEKRLRIFLSRTDKIDISSMRKAFLKCKCEECISFCCNFSCLVVYYYFFTAVESSPIDLYWGIFFENSSVLNFSKSSIGCSNLVAKTKKETKEKKYFFHRKRIMKYIFLV
jgi:hypothetical protein